MAQAGSYSVAGDKTTGTRDIRHFEGFNSIIKKAHKYTFCALHCSLLLVSQRYSFAGLRADRRHLGSPRRTFATIQNTFSSPFLGFARTD